MSLDDLYFPFHLCIISLPIKKKMSLDDFLTDDIFSHGFYPDKDFFCFLICLQDGHLRIFEWPNMRILLDEPSVMSFRDLDFRLA